jgi:hypothetical protein
VHDVTSQHLRACLYERVVLCGFEEVVERFGKKGFEGGFEVSEGGGELGECRSWIRVAHRSTCLMGSEPTSRGKLALHLFPLHHSLLALKRAKHGQNRMVRLLLTPAASKDRSLTLPRSVLPSSTLPRPTRQTSLLPLCSLWDDAVHSRNSGTQQTRKRRSFTRGTPVRRRSSFRRFDWIVASLRAAAELDNGTILTLESFCVGTGHADITK